MELNRRHLLLGSAATLGLACTGGASDPPSEDTMDWTRLERPHWMNGEHQLLISHPNHLTAAERATCPAGLITAFHAWPKVLETLPAALEWARDDLRVRKPVLERSLFNGDRMYWALRYPHFGDPKRLDKACLGTATGGLPSPRTDALGWLIRAFGAADECSEWPSTHWGQTLEQAADPHYLEWLGETCPPQVKDWLVLYSADGDYLLLDPVAEQVHWCGFEWTGDGDLALEVSPEQAIRFVLWSLLRDGLVVPSSLKMLTGT